MRPTRNNALLFVSIFFVLLPFWASADSSFSFSTDAQSIAVAAISSTITVTAAPAVTQTTCLLVSSNSATGQFSSSATTFSAVSAVTMSKNSQNRSFFYMDSSAGTYTLTVRVAPKPDSVAASCASWSDATASVASTITQSITVGSGQAQSQNQPQTQDQTSSSSDSQTQTQISSSGSLPPQITARISLEGAALAGGGVTFDGAAFDASGDTLMSGVRYLWNFGDGATADGQRVQHTYAYPGTYDAVLMVAYNYSSAQASLTVRPAQPAVTLTAEADGSLTVANKSSDDLDIGGWSLTDGAHTFIIPADTTVLAGGGVRFAAGVTGVVGGANDALIYPNGTHAASANPSSGSPLHGEQIAPEKFVSQSQSSPAKPGVGATSQQISPPPAQTQNTDEQPDLGAAAAQSPASNALPLWLAIAGLLVLVVLGGSAVWYLQISQISPGTATSPEPEEFDIE